MIQKFLCLAVIIGGSLVPAVAESIFPVRNEAALSRNTALPALGETAVLAGGASAYSARLDWSNEFVNVRNGNEALLLDGETQRLSFGWRRGVAAGLEIGIDVPILLTNGGVLDSVIEGWHGAFNLANGGREFVPRNRYAYRYIRNGVTELNVTDGHNGFGDIELSAGYALREGLALRALAKLPTGDEARLAGGNAGGALWLDYDPFAGARRWFGFVSAGGSYNAQSQVLGELQRQWVGLGGAGAGYRALPWLAFTAQFYGHTPLYAHSEIGALSRYGGQLAFGGRIGLGAHTALNLGVQEDVILNSSPDFSIHIGVSVR
jgi:hypothetical protein